MLQTAAGQGAAPDLTAAVLSGQGDCAVTAEPTGSESVPAAETC